MHAVPVNLACDLLDLPRSSYYYRSRKTVDEKLAADIQAMAGKYPPLYL